MTDDRPTSSLAGVPTIVRVGCVALIVLGAAAVLLAAQSGRDPKRVRCELARVALSDVNADDKAFNDELNGKPSELVCREAIRLADGIRLRKVDAETISIPSEGAIRSRAVIAGVVGTAQLVGGFALLKSRRRRTRAVMVALAVLGLVFAVAGLLSIVGAMLAIYALGISQGSRQMWPRPNSPG